MTLVKPASTVRPLNVGAPEYVRRISVLHDGCNRASDRSPQDWPHWFGELLPLLNLGAAGSRERNEEPQPNTSSAHGIFPNAELCNL